MQKKIFLIACLSISLKVSSQIPSFVWAKSITSNTLGLTGNNIGSDANGNIYVSGNFLGTADFDPGPGVFNITSYENCCNDIFVVKLNSAGNFIWAKQMGGLNFDRCDGMAVDAAGNVFLTGTFGGTADFDPGAGVYNLVATGYLNMFMSKLDASGNFIWAKNIRGTGIYGGSRDIRVDMPGNVYITGDFSDTCDFDPGSGVYNLVGDTTNGGQNGDVFVAKYDATGNIIWAKRMGDVSAFDEGHSVAVDASGNVYTTGFFGGIGDFDPGVGSYTMAALGKGPNQTNVFISKLNSSGNFVWAKSMGNETATGNSLKIGSTGSVYVAGEYYLTGDFDPGSGTYNLTSAGNNDIFVSELDPSGNFVFAKSMGGSGNDEAFDMFADQFDNLYTAGRFNGAADFDPGPGSFSLTPVSSLDDIFVSKLDANGNFLNAGNMGGTNTDIAFAVIADNSGNVYTTGYYRGVADFDPGSASYTYTNTVNASLFLSKLCTTPRSPSNITNAAAQTICSGNSTTFNVLSAGNVNWYSSPTSTTVVGTGASFVTPMLSTGTYSYYAEANACASNPQRSMITVTVNSSPIVSAVSNNTMLCAGQSATLTASGASSYSWSTASANSSIVVTPSTTSSYTVVGTNVFGCSNSAAVTQSVSQCTTIEMISSKDGFMLYPNPTRGRLSIISDKNNRVIVYNSLGAAIFETNTESGKTEIDISAQATGFYFIKVGTVIKKIIKE